MRARYSAKNFQLKCFLDNNLTKVQTVGLDRSVCNAAYALSVKKLIAKLSEGDLVATEALHHGSCLAALYNLLHG